MTPTIAARFNGRDNNFNLIRFLAASAVLLDHCVALGAGGHPRLLQLGPLTFDFAAFPIGRMAVDVFFVVSGFLVTRSALTRPTVTDYVVARALRLFPALIVVSLAVALLLGPLVTTLPLSAYFTDLKTWIYGPITASLADNNSPLPGVFETGPAPGIINSPLWTLRYEAICYVLLAGLAMVGALINRRIAYSFAGLFAAYLLVTFATPWRGEVAAIDSAARFVLSFFLGGFFFVFAEKIRLHWLAVLGAAALAWVTRETVFAELTFRIALAYGVIWLALVPGGAIRGFNRLGDYSYGLYILCWPVQQTLILAMPQASALVLFAVSFPVTLALAALSWHLVEHPALRQKERAMRKADATVVWLNKRVAGLRGERHQVRQAPKLMPPETPTR
ncbi:acyltransferase [Methyloligella sp. 2.7D]|uniref:acyltransferase family protein n=1 Tax=unclassified Methyloligella TaxID=2625955 RepID=UPI00157C2107|nr:acyltransferase [Methyloligella sp. GL2]QKP77708.1 acyltransferase [Methyloligella sp. GL2]